MSTGYGWEGLRQVYPTLLRVRNVPECLRGGTVYLEALLQIFSFLPEIGTYTPRLKAEGIFLNGGETISNNHRIRQ